MKKFLLGAVLGFLVLMSFNQANATVLTFDDLTSGYYDDINVYGGLNWYNFGVFRKDYDKYVNNAVVSGNFAAVSNMHGQYDSYIYSTNGTFDFTGAYLTSYHFSENPMTFIGRLNGQIIYQNTFTVSNQTPTAIQLNYMDIDRLDVIAGHVNNSSGEYVCMDNFTINEPFNGNPIPTPEPTSAILMLFGGIGSVLLKKSRK